MLLHVPLQVVSCHLLMVARIKTDCTGQPAPFSLLHASPLLMCCDIC
jgi:hypothetical protein